LLAPHALPTRRSSDLRYPEKPSMSLPSCKRRITVVSDRKRARWRSVGEGRDCQPPEGRDRPAAGRPWPAKDTAWPAEGRAWPARSEEHTSELQSRENL